MHALLTFDFEDARHLLPKVIVINYILYQLSATCSSGTLAVFVALMHLNLKNRSTVTVGAVVAATEKGGNSYKPPPALTPSAPLCLR